MQPAQTYDRILRQVRTRICPRCPHCPRHEAFGDSHSARSCAPTCALAQHLPELARIARLRDPVLSSAESMLREIDDRCDESSRAEGLAGEPNPLNLFRHELVEILTASPKRRREMSESFLG